MAARITQDNTADVMARARVALRDAVYAGALVIENEAKLRAPVLTGTLRRSINTQVENRGELRVVARIGPNTDYAAFLEFGTSRMAARPYMRPALDSKRAEATATVIRIFADAMRLENFHRGTF